MNTNSHIIEITVISGEELYVNRRQKVKKNAFVVVRTYDACNVDDQRTRIDKDGGSYPSWNEKLVVNLPSHARFINVEVHCKTHNGDKLVGTAKIPTSDFLGGYVPETYLHFLSYRLKDAYGERNEIINLSVQGKYSKEQSKSVTRCSVPWPGIPVNDKVSSEKIVTGFPVGYRF